VAAENGLEVTGHEARDSGKLGNGRGSERTLFFLSFFIISDAERWERSKPNPQSAAVRHNNEK
jgi:hypothetical protein